MGKRLSKIYTRTGDDGTTGLGDGTRTPKDSPRVEAYGTVDEANSAIGVVLSHGSLPDSVRSSLTEVQHDLFELGGELCIPGHSAITAPMIDRLERDLDAHNSALPALNDFILPGGSPAAERRTRTLAEAESVRNEVLRYLNRLSDLLFVYARVLSRMEGGSEVLWNRERG